MVKYITGLLCLVVLLSSCGKAEQSEEVNNTPEQTQETQQATTSGYSNFTAEGVVSLEYPSDWTTQEGFMGTVVAIMSPMSDENDAFSENMNFLTQEFSVLGVDNLDDYIQFNLDQMNVLFTDFAVLSQEDVSIDWVNGKKIVYTFSQGELGLYTTQYILNNNQTAYIFTITHGSDDTESFSTEFETILNSIEIL